MASHRHALALLCASACGSEAPSPPAGSAIAPVDTATLATAPSALVPCPVAHRTLGPGLAVERWAIATGCIDVVRADTTRFTLTLLSSSSEPGAPRDAATWLSSFHLHAVVNAGMFHASGEPVGLVVANGVALSDDNRKMSGYLAWDPVDANDPPITLASRGCSSFNLTELRARYHSIVQSYRLLECDGSAISWLDPKRHSVVAIALDRTNHVVFLHTEAAVTMADFSRAIAAHDLTGALFLEGGSGAALYAKGSDAELATASPGPLPNIIGLLPR